MRMSSRFRPQRTGRSPRTSGLPKAHSAGHGSFRCSRTRVNGRSRRSKMSIAHRSASCDSRFAEKTAALISFSVGSPPPHPSSGTARRSPVTSPSTPKIPKGSRPLGWKSMAGWNRSPTSVQQSEPAANRLAWKSASCSLQLVASLTAPGTDNGKRYTP